MKFFINPSKLWIFVGILVGVGDIGTTNINSDLALQISFDSI